MKKINSVLNEVIKNISPSEDNIKTIENFLEDFLKKLNKRIKSKGIKANVFVGGSFAKKTAIKKDIHDIDLFLRFERSYRSEEISNITKKLLENIEETEIIHGSRDYFKIRGSDFFYVEIIPVIKVRNPREAQNITDLSYSHVNYIKRKIKNKKILDEIKLAKAFCVANHCYGAESYIQGFSGYSLELLIDHYRSFIKFIKAISKHSNKEKLIIDPAKYYKNKKQVLLDINSSKLQSPIILIDPTYKHRNVSAALSLETFKKFQKSCKDFLKNPNLKDFEPKKTDLDKIKKDSKKKKLKFVLLEAYTNKQVGDIAGSKLLKFYKHLNQELSKSFHVKNKGFNYNQQKAARYFFIVKPKEEILVKGPKVSDKKHVKAFKKKHKNYFTKKGRIYSKIKVEKDIKKFIEDWKTKNKKRTKEMYIDKLDVLEG
ncbi:MAG: nucleotidyltransferase domain-containing protein [Candidatus Nanoarchaeia archaeon]